MPWAGWRRALKSAALSLAETELSIRCAGVAFFSFLSLFPAIASGVLVYGLVGDPAKLQDQFDTLSLILPAQAAAIIGDQLADLLAKPEEELGIGLAIGLGLALWSGSRGVNTLVFALSKSQYEEENRPFVLAALLSLALTLGGFVVAILALFALAVLPASLSIIPAPDLAETIALWVRWPILAAIVFCAAVILYRVAPHRADPKFRWVTPGAALTTVLWLAASILFSVYVENFGSYDATFGSLAAVVILMLWFYYSTMIFVLGSRLNAELELQTKRDSTTGLDRPIGERGAYVADNVR